jgi:hypothetical protein
MIVGLFLLSLDIVKYPRFFFVITPTENPAAIVSNEKKKQLACYAKMYWEEIIIS